jgi:sugar phosphate isomerase/epimerase
MNEAAESGQEYLIVSSLPTQGQTIDNYKSVAEQFNEAGDACKKMGIKFGYHNHDFEFEKEKDTVLYDVLLDETLPALASQRHGQQEKDQHRIWKGQPANQKNV